MITRYFGMDIHKQFAMIAAVNREQQVIRHPNRVEMDELAEWAAGHLTTSDEVAIEVTTNAWFVHDLLAQYAGKVVVTNPYKTKLIAEARIKSDKVDALVLARLLASNFTCDVWVPQPQVRHDRNLAEHHISLKKQRTRIKNRLHNTLRRHNLNCPEKSIFTRVGRAWLIALKLHRVDKLQIRHLLQQFDLLEELINETDQLISQRAYQDPRTIRLMQLTGIGYFAAFTILAIIGDINRFSSADNLTSYAGLVPSLHQSGNHSYSGHITKRGSSTLRWIMVETARVAVRWDPHWKRFYERIRRKRGSNVAAVAVARKMLVVIWHLLVHNSHYHYLQPQTFVTKLQTWALRIGKANHSYCSSISFVRHALSALGLLHLSKSLFSDPKGRLRFQSS